MSKKDKTIKKAKDLLSSLDWLFETQNFETYMNIREKDEDDLALSVSIDIPYKYININFYPKFFESKPKEQRKYLLHEMCHTLTERLFINNHSLLNGLLITKKQIKDDNELSVCTITNILDNLLDDKLKFAKDAYNDYLK